MSDDPITSSLRMIGKSLRLSAKAGRLGGNVAANGAHNVLAARGRRAGGRGVLGPGDPPPPPGTGDFYDYRGLARGRDVAHASGPFRLGRLREPAGRWRLQRSELSLSADHLRRNALLLGPPDAGKTASLVVPWIHGALAGGQSVVAVDVKGNLFEHLAAYSAAAGRLNVRAFHWDYGNPARSESWNWISEIASEEEVDIVVEAILGRDPGRGDPFWFHQDQRFLNAMLTLAPHLPEPTARAMQQLLTDSDAMRDWLMTVGPQPAAQALLDLFRAHPDRYAEKTAGILNKLHWLSGTAITRVTEERRLTLDLLERQPCLMIVGARATGGPTAEISASIFLALTVHRLLSRFRTAGRPTMLMLDEAPRIQSRLRLPELLSLGREAGVSTVLAAQNVTQFDKQVRSELLNNCATVVAMPGVSKETTTFLADRLGQRQSRERTSNTVRSAPWDPLQHGIGEQLRTVAVLDHREIAAPPFAGRPAIVHAPLCAAPLLVDLTRPDLA